MSIAYRGDGSDRPQGIPLPPARPPMLRGWRLRKHWRYVGVWSPAVSICAATVRVGPLAQEFWGVWDRDSGQFTEHSRLRLSRVHLSASRVRVADRRGTLDLELDGRTGSSVEVVTPVGRAWTWTHKRVAHAVGRAEVQGRRLSIEGAALLEDSDGYHPRHTHWSWAAGAGTLSDGRLVMWNLVVGLNDRPPHRENTVWIDGTPFPLGPVLIDPDLTGVRFDDGHRLRFHPEAQCARRINLIVIRTSYRHPFGTFSGTLPGGLQLAEGHGVMEDHRALW